MILAGRRTTFSIMMGGSSTDAWADETYDIDLPDDESFSRDRGDSLLVVEATDLYGDPHPDDVFIDAHLVATSALSVSEALAEIAASLNEVDMSSLPAPLTPTPCQQPGVDPNDWFDPLQTPEFITFPPTRLDEVAELLCRGCSIIDECGEWGLANPRQKGILGGMTERRRAVVRLNRKLA